MLTNLEGLSLNLVQTMMNIRLNIVYGNHIKTTDFLQPCMNKTINFIFPVCLIEE